MLNALPWQRKITMRARDDRIKIFTADHSRSRARYDNTGRQKMHTRRPFDFRKPVTRHVIPGAPHQFSLSETTEYARVDSAKIMNYAPLGPAIRSPVSHVACAAPRD